MALNRTSRHIQASGSAWKRPYFDSDTSYSRDRNWRCLRLFHDYFHGETGKGQDESHQTGWTALGVCAT